MPSGPSAASCAAPGCTARRWRPSRRPTGGARLPAQRAVDHRRPGRALGALPPEGGVGAGAAVLIVDDHSRLLVDGRFFAHENARACQELLRRAITHRGVPEVLYADNGAPFSNAWLARTCGVLGIRLVHSKPYSPEGRGKQERLNRYIREAFLAEATHQGIESLDQLTTCSPRGPSGSPTAGCTPRPARPRSAGSRPPGRPARPARTGSAGVPLVSDPPVTRTATVPLEGNAYAVDPALVGRRVELRYDPEDLTVIEVFLDGKPAGPPPRSSPAGTCTAPSRRPPARSGPDRDRLPRPGRRGARGSRRHRSQDRLHPAGRLTAGNPARTRNRDRRSSGGAAPWAAHFGLSRTPRQVDPRAGPVRPQAHAEAIARISFCVDRAGSPGRRRRPGTAAAVAGLDPPATSLTATRRSAPPSTDDRRALAPATLPQAELRPRHPTCSPPRPQKAPPRRICDDPRSRPLEDCGF